MGEEGSGREGRRERGGRDPNPGIYRTSSRYLENIYSLSN